jgi:hypothetical protein
MRLPHLRAYWVARSSRATTSREASDEIPRRDRAGDAGDVEEQVVAVGERAGVRLVDRHVGAPGEGELRRPRRAGAVSAGFDSSLSFAVTPRASSRAACATPAAFLARTRAKRVNRR